jgi:hypothetical protein
VLDYSFFALMFLLATSLSPAGAPVVTLENSAHPEQEMVWTRQADGRWAMTINRRDMGHFVREGDAVVHHTGVRAPERHPIASLADRRDLRPGAAAVRLLGESAGRSIRVSRQGDALRLDDPSRRTLPIPLLLR